MLGEAASLDITTKRSLWSGGSHVSTTQGQNVPDREAQVKAVGGVTEHNDICIFRLQKVQEETSAPSHDQKGCVAQERQEGLK